MHVVYLLMCHTAIVLENVVLLCATGSGKFCRDWEELAEGVVGYIGQISAVVLWNDELGRYILSLIVVLSH